MSIQDWTLRRPKEVWVTKKTDSMQVRSRWLTVLALTLGVVAGAPLDVRAQKFGEAPLEYKIFCARCHGFTGQGDGPDTVSLSTRPRDFANCVVMSKISDDTVFNAIKNGGAAVGLPKEMPAWGAGLSDREIHDLAAYIRTFCKK